MSLEEISIQDLNLEVEHEKLHIKFEENDTFTLEKVRIFKSTFSNLGLKKANFTSCSVNNSLFEKCYLRYATFNNIDFTGSSFESCDLQNTKFNSCNLRYVKIRNCHINLKEVLGCLPQETNLKINLLKELRMNQLSVGENKSADELLIKILDAEKDLLMERVKCATSYHKEREDLLSRVLAYLNYISLVSNDLVWGYGLRLSRLFRAGLILVFFFALLIYYFTGSEYITSSVNGAILVKLDFWDSFYASYTNFTTIGYGNYIPITWKTQLIFAIENLLGLIFLGFLISGVYRRIAK
ncbi:ion channel [Salipaludibacillus sp. HK11]|uniref:ion channel n=1 Tax=Salipaludibacillus sp. HK11 TaxID=3394320 RepID=UPI0039FD39FE